MPFEIISQFQRHIPNFGKKACKKSVEAKNTTYISAPIGPRTYVLFRVSVLRSMMNLISLKFLLKFSQK